MAENGKKKMESKKLKFSTNCTCTTKAIKFIKG